MSEISKKYQRKLFIGSSHTWAFEQLEKTNKEARVLDFGAGTGVMGEKLQELGVDNIYAVDIDDEACANLTKTYKQACTELKDIKQEEFDLILLLDILEHLTHPEDFLRAISKRLSTGGTILISLPNIAHWSIRFSLLLGFFEYTDRGLLDRTHYNHFNRRRVKRMIGNMSDLNIEEMRASTSPVEFVLPDFICDTKVFQYLSKFRLTLANIFPGLLGYQHLIRIKKQ